MRRHRTIFKFDWEISREESLALRHFEPVSSWEPKQIPLLAAGNERN